MGYDQAFAAAAHFCYSPSMWAAHLRELTTAAAAGLARAAESAAAAGEADGDPDGRHLNE